MTDEHNHENHRSGDQSGLHPSCLACQESYLRDSGEIKASLKRLEQQGEEARQTLSKIPVITTEHDAMKATIIEHSSSILDLRLEHARGKGMLVVIGVIVGIIGTFLSSLFNHRFGGVN
jgi:hypothetical protein